MFIPNTVEFGIWKYLRHSKSRARSRHKCQNVPRGKSLFPGVINGFVVLRADVKRESTAAVPPGWLGLPEYCWQTHRGSWAARRQCPDKSLSPLPASLLLSLCARGYHQANPRARALHNNSSPQCERRPPKPVKWRISPIMIVWDAPSQSRSTPITVTSLSTCRRPHLRYGMRGIADLASVASLCLCTVGRKTYHWETPSHRRPYRNALGVSESQLVNTEGGFRALRSV